MQLPVDQPLAVRVLGPLEVRVQGRRITHWPSRRSRAVLRILAVHRDRPVSREWLMDQLWPHAPAASAGNSLNVAVCSLRRVLRAAAPAGAGPAFVVCRDGGYQLTPGLAAWVDVEQFDRHHRLGAAARHAGDAALVEAHFRAATDLYRGPLFEDDGADWHLERRLAVHDTFCDMLEELAGLRIDRGEIDRTEQACRRLLAVDPGREGAHRLLMRCFAERGEFDRAVRQYGRCADVLARELEVVPDRRTAALYQEVKARLSADRDPSPARASGSSPGVRSTEAGVPPRRYPGRHSATEGNTMPSANDAEITEIYSASVGLDVADNEPNSPPPGGVPAATFDMQLEMVAGNAIGGGGGNYQLTLTCIDETLGAPNAGMSRGPLNQQFLVANGWQASGAAGNFFNKQRFNIAVPAGLRGHIFRYLVTLVAVDSNVVSFRESNRFILT
ncbi:MAG: AfsR/SARP family transcriptional regulator [Pseudonocardia sp.]